MRKAPSSKRFWDKLQEAKIEPVRVLDWRELIRQIDTQMQRLGWSKANGVDYIQRTYGYRTRLRLTDEQQIEFRDYLTNFKG